MGCVLEGFKLEGFWPLQLQWPCNMQVSLLGRGSPTSLQVLWRLAEGASLPFGPLPRGTIGTGELGMVDRAGLPGQAGHLSSHGVGVERQDGEADMGLGPP